MVICLILHDKDISIVIPAYKSEKTIARTLNSLLLQSGVNLEVVVVEDGVFDELGSVLKEYNFVKHVQLDKNIGACKARNIGLDFCTNEYVMFLDSDDFLEGDILLDLHNQINKIDSDVAIGQCKIVYGDKVIVFSPTEKDKEYLNVANRWLRGDWGPGTCSVLWRKKSIENIGGWNENILRNQDGELMIRASINGLKFSISKYGYGVYVKDFKKKSVSKLTSRESFYSQIDIVKYVKNNLGNVPYDKVVDLMKSLEVFNFIQASHAFSVGYVDLGEEFLSETNRFSVFRLHSNFIFKFLSIVFGVRLGRILWDASVLLKSKVSLR